MTHVEEWSTNFKRCQKDEESFSVMNALYTRVLDRGILCFGSSRTHIIVKKWHPPHVMVWEAMNSEHTFGPYFFNGPVNHLNYLTMLEN